MAYPPQCRRAAVWMADSVLVVPPEARKEPAILDNPGAHGEGLVRKEAQEMYFSAYHFVPIIHGYVTFPPLLTTLLRKLAVEFPSERTLQVFQRVGVDTVLVHRGRPGEEQFYARVDAAAAAGKLELLARFSGERANLFQSTADEVYRIVPLAAPKPAPFPHGIRRIDPDWHYRTKLGNPALAADGDLATAWTVQRQLRGDEFFEVSFPEPLRVSGLVLRLRRGSQFASRFKIAGRDTHGQWNALAWFDESHTLQLVERLLEDPAGAAIGFDLDGLELTAIMLMVEPEGESFFGWSIPEIEVLVNGSEPR